MRNTGLHHTRMVGREDVLLERLEDAVAQTSSDHTDTPPDSGLRGVATPERGRNRDFREFSDALIGNDVGGKWLQADPAFAVRRRSRAA